MLTAVPPVLRSPSLVSCQIPNLPVISIPSDFRSMGGILNSPFPAAAAMALLTGGKAKGKGGVPPLR